MTAKVDNPVDIEFDVYADSPEEDDYPIPDTLCAAHTP
jgi:hypothetical protein